MVAEAVRDSLGAGPLAGELFLRLQREHPQSSIAPKALLAAAALFPATADSLLAVVDREYPDSPYRLAVRGLDAPRYAEVEDSLRALLAPAGEAVRAKAGDERKRAAEDQIRETRRPGKAVPARRTPEP